MYTNARLVCIWFRNRVAFDALKKKRREGREEYKRERKKTREEE